MYHTTSAWCSTYEREFYVALTSNFAYNIKCFGILWSHTFPHFFLNQNTWMSWWTCLCISLNKNTISHTALSTCCVNHPCVPASFLQWGEKGNFLDVRSSEAFLSVISRYCGFFTLKIVCFYSEEKYLQDKSIQHNFKSNFGKKITFEKYACGVWSYPTSSPVIIR